MADFHENGVCILIFIFKTPKGTYLRETVSFDVFCVNIGFGPSAAASLKNQKTNILGVIFYPYGEKKPWSDLHKILHWGDIQDVITDANFGDDLLSCFCVAMGQILGFSIGFRRRPYTLEHYHIVGISH